MAGNGPDSGSKNAAPDAPGAEVGSERQAITNEFLSSASQLLLLLEGQLDALRRADRPDVEPIIDACERAVDEVRGQLGLLRTAAGDR
jgi:hypothetical protein